MWEKRCQESFSSRTGGGRTCGGGHTARAQEGVAQRVVRSVPAIVGDLGERTADAPGIRNSSPLGAPGRAVWQRVVGAADGYTAGLRIHLAVARMAKEQQRFLTPFCTRRGAGGCIGKVFLFGSRSFFLDRKAG
jgi:hypothetical protein